MTGSYRTTFRRVAIILVGSRLVGENDLSYGDFYLFWFFLGRFFQPIRAACLTYSLRPPSVQRQAF